jgi:hypothetical protein
VQAVTFATLNVPATQFVQVAIPDPVLNFPGSQFMQDPMAVKPEVVPYVPPAQNGMQVAIRVAPTLVLYVPPAQSGQKGMVGALLYFPGSQFVQVAEELIPSPEEYLPSVQLTQTQ